MSGYAGEISLVCTGGCGRHDVDVIHDSKPASVIKRVKAGYGSKYKVMCV